MLILIQQEKGVISKHNWSIKFHSFICILNLTLHIHNYVKLKPVVGLAGNPHISVSRFKAFQMPEKIGERK